MSGLRRRSAEEEREQLVLHEDGAEPLPERSVAVAAAAPALDPTR